MSVLSSLADKMPGFQSVLLAIFSSILLIFAFPDFELWFLAWFALIPLFFSIAREKDSFTKSFFVGWVSGTAFFFGTCWWLTFAPITYAGFPAILAYFLLFCVTAFAGLYIGLFGGILSLFLKRFRYWGFLAAPFLWTALEFLRLWTTGNNWNALGYSQAFNAFVNVGAFGGVPIVSFCVAMGSALFVWYLRFIERGLPRTISVLDPRKLTKRLEGILFRGHRLPPWQETLFQKLVLLVPAFFIYGVLFLAIFSFDTSMLREPFSKPSVSYVVAIQPNVPMSGLTQTKWLTLRRRQAQLAERALKQPSFQGMALRQAEIDTTSETLEKRKRFYEELVAESYRKSAKVVVLPESPMNFQYEQDPEFRQFIKEFAVKNDVAVLFNSAEPDPQRKNGYFNSAVMVNAKGEKITQYDKIYLLPFGEFVPLPDFLGQFIPTMVGRFSPGEEYDLLPFGDVKAGVMICFESHFPSLAREYARNGADVLVEMTNDGYLGDTPVLRQHLASAVFRAVETNRPVLRVTNVGVTAYINERGAILDEAGVYQEATRVWAVSKSDGKETIYVKYGEWFAWLCSLVSLGLLFLCFLRKKK